MLETSPASLERQCRRMDLIYPSSAVELADIFAEASSRRSSVCLVGNNSKRLVGGPTSGADMTISTAKLTRMIDYQPRDLTVSVEAGYRLEQLQEQLAQNGQKLALDPPDWPGATVGGMVATNGSGPLRRAHGTARDIVIGMTFARMSGGLVKAGGKVVKNVAGLDMAKLLIGSFGTLAAMTAISFRVHPVHEVSETFVFECPTIEEVIDSRNKLLATPLKPCSFDLVSPLVAAELGFSGYLVLYRAAGSKVTIDRYRRDLVDCQALNGADEQMLWSRVRNFTPDFLARQHLGIVIRISLSDSDSGTLLRATNDPTIVRAGSGVSYVYSNSPEATARLLAIARDRCWPAVVECASDEVRSRTDFKALLESAEHSRSFQMMKKIKYNFDPATLLNRLRLYGQI